MHLVEQGQAGVLEVIGLLFDLGGSGGSLTRLALGDELAESSNLLLDLLSLGLVKTVFELLEGLLGIVDNAVGTVGGLNGVLALLVLLGIALGIVNHGLNLRFRKTGSGSDGDGLILVGGLILGMHVDDRISIDVEGDLNLGNATVSRGDANKLEVSKQLVVTDKLTLALVDLDLNGALEVRSGREHLALLGRDGGVAVDQTSEDTTESLDTERERGNIEEQEISDLTSEDGTLNGGTNGNSLVRVNRLGRVTAEDALNGLGNLGHTGHTTDKENLVDVLGLEVGILHGLADGLHSPGDERVYQLLKLGTSELRVDVLGSGSVGSDEGKVDIGAGRAGKLNLGLLSSLTNTLDSHAVVVELDTLLLLELLNQVADEGDIEVLTTEMSVTVGGLDLEHAVLDLEDGDIESSTTKIIDSNDGVLGLVQTIGKSSGSGLVHHTEDVQTSDLTGILGGLTLGVVEVGRDGDNGVLHLLSEESLSSLLHLSKDEATNLGWGVLLSLSLEPCITIGVLDDLVRHLLDIALDFTVGELAADETLCGEEGVFGVDDGLTLGGNTDKTLTLLCEAYDGRSCAAT